MGAEPYAPKQVKAITGGGEGKDDTYHGLYFQNLESRSEPKNKTLEEEMINQQSAARSTSSTEQHKLICQLRNNTRPLALDRQTTTATEAGTTATTKHGIHTHFSKESSRGKKTPNNALRGRMHATTEDWFLPWILCTYFITFAWHSLTIRGTCIIQPSRPRGRSHSHCCCGFSWRTNRNHYYYDPLPQYHGIFLH